MSNLNQVYEKIYNYYGVNKNKKKQNFFKCKYLKLILFICLLTSYLIVYIHNFKSKIIYKTLISNYDKDYLGIFLLLNSLQVFLYILYEYIDKISLKKFLQYTLFVFYCILLFFLIIYNFLDLKLKFLSFYFYENILINSFQLFGINIILFFYNQLIFFISFLCFIFIKWLKPDWSYYLFGLWSHLSIKYLLIGSVLIFLYIITSIFLDMIFNSSSKINNNDDILEIKTETLNSESKIIKSEFNELKQNQFNKEIIDTIYLDIIQTPVLEEDLSEQLLKLLKTFYIEGEIFKVLKSITITNYFFKPKVGTKNSRIESIEEELAMNLNRNIRVAMSIQGVIFEIENKHPQSFSFKTLYNKTSSIVESIINKYTLPIFLGFDSLGEVIIFDLSKQPHILIGGTTGSGKSSTLHTIIHSLIINKSPEEIKFLFIDPKILELSIYKNINYLWKDIITSIESSEKALEELVIEMENRYKLIAQVNKRSIIEYNKTYKPLPYIIFAIEEFADLILYKNSNFQNYIQRLAQMGRAAGIHGIICTQRPSANVVNGVIKANFPTRICLKVANKLESRIILDMSGGEKLSNPGEFIILDGTSIPKRGLCPYIQEEEIFKLIKLIQNI